MAQYTMGHNLEGNIQTLKWAIEKGYPTANLYFKLGNFYFQDHQFNEARQAYLMAEGCHPNYTNANGVLHYMDQLKLK